MSDSYNARRQLDVNGKKYAYYSLDAIKDVKKLPFSLKILLENQLRHEDGTVVTKADIDAFPQWLKEKKSTHEIAYTPARVLLQDFTGVPCLVDLAAMRDAVKRLGGRPLTVNPNIPCHLVIDHSAQVDVCGNKDAFRINLRKEFERNGERYRFLKWGQKAFKNFSTLSCAIKRFFCLRQ